MKLPVVFLPEAQADLEDAFQWYESHRPGLGSDLLKSLDEAIDQIQANGSAFAKLHGDVRRVLVRRFLYAVYFRESNDQFLILAVFHARRNPKVWKHRA
jgi:plasmid stabilization system protein ParE